MFSGGTFHSAMTAHVAGPADEGGLLRTAPGRGATRGPVLACGRWQAAPDPVLGYWLLPLPTIDPIVVARSGAALPAYGPNFRYSHYAGTKTLRFAAGGAVAVAALGLGRPGQAAPQPPARHGSSRATGPDESRREKSWFRVDFVGEAGGQTVHTRVSGGDPGYDETAKMLAESALCLALDDNPVTAGQVTTAAGDGRQPAGAASEGRHRLRGRRLTLPFVPQIGYPNAKRHAVSGDSRVCAG